jgi:ATP/maltotriose-dependent transcriptional regulator MalT
MIRGSLAELDRLGALDDVEKIGEVAVDLAVWGHTALAAPLAERAVANPRYLDLTPHFRRLLEASIDWGRGATDEAERKISAVQGLPSPNARYHGLVMGAALATSRGDCRRTVALLEQVRALRFTTGITIRNCDLPLALHSLASCYEKLGDLAKARERNAEMLRLWAKADPDLPLLLDAKAMQARLAVK